ncbi:uncharacterized protein LOC134711432 [Mytilus trossulus]|uniref:uncharacterized protein LOC134711432 n=1 Tax=Mytilus trossulus TaxID=6551 RepID=UPI003005F49F
MCQDSHSYAFEEQVTLVRDTFHGVVVLLQGYQVSFVTAILKPVDFTLYAFEVRNGLGTGKLLVQLKHLIEDPNAECLNTDKSQATIYVSVLIMMIFIILIFSVYHIILVKRVKNQTNKNKDNVVSVESQYEEIQMEEAGTNDVLRRSIECLAPELNEGSRSIECLAPELNEGPSSSDDYDDNYLDERSVSGSIESEDKRGESQYESFEKNQDEQYLSNHAYTEGRLSDTFVKDVIEG